MLDCFVALLLAGDAGGAGRGIEADSPVGHAKTSGNSSYMPRVANFTAIADEVIPACPMRPNQRQSSATFGDERTIYYGKQIT
jgi:hypothetical protein